MPLWPSSELAITPLAGVGPLTSNSSLPSPPTIVVVKFGLVPWTFVYCSMIGSINATASGLAMRDFGHAAGMASALIGIFLYGGGTLASLAMGSFVTPATPLPLTGLMAVFGLCGVVTYLLFRPRPAG